MGTAVLAFLLAACGGGASHAASSSSTTAPGKGPVIYQNFTACLVSHGVPASEAQAMFARRRPATGSSTTTPRSTPPSFPRATIPSKYQSAFSACRSLLPARGGFGSGADSPQFAAYRNCLQLHGVTLPTTRSTSPPTTTAAFEAARMACAALLPTRSPAGSTTSTTTSPAT